MIRPFNPAQEVLLEAGILKNQKTAGNDGKVEPSAVQTILDNAGASLIDAATALATGLSSDKSRVQSARLVFELHGALREAEKPQAPMIQINIQNVHERKSLLQFVTPSDDELPLVEESSLN